MKLANEFMVPVTVQEAWPILLDVERIVPCMPGAELVGKAGDGSYKGRVSVQLGPVALTFDGIAKFTEIDEPGQRARVTATGSDKKGRGGAHATVAFHLEPDGDSSRVLIDTDLQLSGSIAQYGRASGLISNVAKELIRQFAENLGKELRKPVAVTEVSGTIPEPDTAVGPKPISGIRLAIRIALTAIGRRLRQLVARG
jgi:uncharacterized protein